jgi:hypothetical protein
MMDVRRIGRDIAMADLDRFQSVLRDWLVRNDLDSDLHFYSRDEWGVRREEVLNSAEFVVVTEGDLHFLLNYNFAHPKVDELQDLCESFGCWFELGRTWSIGFYIDDSDLPTPTPERYVDKLKDPRWKKKASAVKKRANYSCEDCGVQDIALEAHHCWYRYGLEPWQYPLDAFRCLCRQCHEDRAPVEHRTRALMARFSTREVEAIRGALERLFHWYDREAVQNFLDCLGPNEVVMEEAAMKLRDQKTEPGAV